jgi:hypothetical protein
MSRFTGEIEDLEGTVQMASEAMLSWLKQIDGYRGLLALADTGSGTACFMTFWESAEAAEKSRASRASMRNQLAATAGAEVLGTDEYAVIFRDELSDEPG